MSDASKADAFGQIFSMLGSRLYDIEATPSSLVKEQALSEVKRMAREIYGISDQYDFHPYEMECDEDLLKLELCRWNPSLNGEDSNVEYLKCDYE